MTYPTLHWRDLLLSRSSAPSLDQVQPGLELLGALLLARSSVKPVLLVAEAAGWAYVPYDIHQPVLGPKLAGLTIVGLESQAILIDWTGAMGIAGAGDSVKATGLNFKLSELGLGKSAPSLKEIANFENLRRALEGRPLLPVLPTRLQKNHGLNEAWLPDLILDPTSSVDELVDVMGFVERAGATTVKAGGSRHSWSRAAASNQVYIQPDRMNFVQALVDDPQQSTVLRADADVETTNLFLIGSGTRIREINDQLWAKGKALPVLGGYDGQTIAGVVQTATHGSVLRSGPIAVAVLAINLVDFHGRRIRIERADGPTNPTAFVATFEGWDLRKDDDLFNAALMSVGAFGVVHSYIVKVADAFYLKETRTQTTLGATRELLRGGNIYRLMDVDQPVWLPPEDGRRLDERHGQHLYHLEFLLNPHRVGGADNTVIVTSRARIRAPDPEPPAFAHERDIAKNLFRVLTVNSKFSRPWLTTWLTENFPWLVGAIPEVIGKVLPDTIPELLEFGMTDIVDTAYENRSYNVFNIGQGQNSIPALSSEPSIPLRDDLYLQALDLILERAADFAKQGKYHTGPLSMRFVAGSHGMLDAHEDVCRFEIIFTGGTKYAPAMMRDYEDALYARFGGDVRPHWGQINNLSAATRPRLNAMYPRLNAWKALRSAYDPEGVFLNDWQRELFF